jgi:sialate O-acetylesterase
MLQLLSALLLVPLASSAESGLTFSALFADHMVLQRDQPVPVWGSAKPNDQITVTFADQKKNVIADAEGKWVVKLDALKASVIGRELTVKSASSAEMKIADVLVGDVWLCSGQSNMHFQMKSVENAPQEISGLNAPAVRFFTVKQDFGQAPLNQTSGSWKPVSPSTAADCSAVACYFGIELYQKQNVPIGLLVSSVGGTRIESWMRAETLAATGESLTLIEKWKSVSAEEFDKIGVAYSKFQYERDFVHPKAVKAAKDQGKPVPPAPIAPKQRCHDCPSALHNGMIATLQPFAIRGAIWYQGESNSGQPKPYEKLLPAMIADWRNVWGKDLPFLFVQLAPHNSIHPSFRESQHRIWQSTPHTAMVVTTDVGNANNIHPTRKRPVGERLAIAARALVYGENVVSSGPIFDSLKIQGNRVVISFAHVGGGLIANEGELKGFTIAGDEGKFLPAIAKIESNTVIVTSDKITKPAAVRYNWSILPDGNLFNREGLPAAPFRSDQSLIERN